MKQAATLQSYWDLWAGLNDRGFFPYFVLLGFYKQVFSMSSFVFSSSMSASSAHADILHVFHNHFNYNENVESWERWISVCGAWNKNLASYLGSFCVLFPRQNKRELKFWRIMGQVWGDQVWEKISTTHWKSKHPDLDQFWLESDCKGCVLFLLLFTSSCDYSKYTFNLSKAASPVCLCVCMWMSICVSLCVTMHVWSRLHEKTDVMQST